MMTEHWLSIAAGVFLVGMMLYGHYRGLLRQCVSLGALVLTIITVKVATPYVTDFVKANPVIRENAAHFIMEVSGWQPPEESESILPAAQRMAIEELKLPQSVKDVLLENNNSEFYRLLGVDQFGEYISENEWKTAEHLNRLPEETIQKMADVYSEGYRIGFVNTGKDLSKKSVVNIRYILGFERVVKKAIENFEKMGLKPVYLSCSGQCVDKETTLQDRILRSSGK